MNKDLGITVKHINDSISNRADLKIAIENDKQSLQEGKTNKFYATNNKFYLGYVSKITTVQKELIKGKFYDHTYGFITTAYNLCNLENIDTNIENKSFTVYFNKKNYVTDSIYIDNAIDLKEGEWVLFVLASREDSYYALKVKRFVFSKSNLDLLFSAIEKQNILKYKNQDVSRWVALDIIKEVYDYNCKLLGAEIAKQIIVSYILEAGKKQKQRIYVQCSSYEFRAFLIRIIPLELFLEQTKQFYLLLTYINFYKNDDNKLELIRDYLKQNKQIFLSNNDEYIKKFFKEFIYKANVSYIKSIAFIFETLDFNYDDIIKLYNNILQLDIDFLLQIQKNSLINVQHIKALLEDDNIDKDHKYKAVLLGFLCSLNTNEKEELLAYFECNLEFFKHAIVNIYFSEEQYKYIIHSTIATNNLLVSSVVNSIDLDIDMACSIVKHLGVKYCYSFIENFVQKYYAQINYEQLQTILSLSKLSTSEQDKIIANYFSFNLSNINVCLIHEQDNIIKYSNLNCSNVKKQSLKNDDQLLTDVLNKVNVIICYDNKAFISKYFQLNNAIILDCYELDFLCNLYNNKIAVHKLAKPSLGSIINLFYIQLKELHAHVELFDKLDDISKGELKKLYSLISVDIFEKYQKAFNIQKKTVMKRNIDKDYFNKIEQINTCLKRIKDNNLYNRALIIANRSHWLSIAKYIAQRINFINNTTYTILNNNFVLNDQNCDVVESEIIRIFIDVAPTPILELLPETISSKCIIKNTHNFLENKDIESKFDCCDMLYATIYSDILKNYDYFVIVDKYQNKILHKKFIKKYTDKDINNTNPSLPLHYHKGSCYIKLDSQDLKRLNLNSDDNSCYIAKQVYNYTSKLSEYQIYKYTSAYLKFKNDTYKQIEFEDNNSPKYTIIVTQEEQNLRVKNTKNKIDYWKNQLQLITHCSNNIKSIVYIIENEYEVKVVQDLIQENQSKFDYILTNNSDLNSFVADNNNKTIFITHIDKFVNNLDKLDNNNKLCFIFDSILYDLYKIIYAQDNELDLINNVIEGIFSLYFNKIFNNNISSEIYIIDPIFEELADLEDEYVNDNYEFLKNIELVKLQTSIDIDTKDYFNNVSIMQLDICSFAKKYFLYGKKLHDKQQLYLPIILNPSKNLVINLPTGFGKSLLFQSCALYKFFKNNSLTVVISPLNALMQDQVESLNKYPYFKGLIDYINSSKTKAQINRIYRKIVNKELAILYVSPERFMVKSFYELIFNNLDLSLAYIVFDEAHCIFQWSNDFRPDYYLALEKTLLLHNLTDARLLFLSATLTAKMQDELFSKVDNTVDIDEIAYADNQNTTYDYVESAIDKLSSKMQLFVRNKTIKNFEYDLDLNTSIDIDSLDDMDDFIDLDNNYSIEISSVIKLFEDNKLNIDITKSNIIIFCKTIYQARTLKEALNNRAYSDKSLNKDTIFAKLYDRIDCFYASLSSRRKEDIYNRYKRSNKDDGINVLCATKAFGMGIDIPNIHVVIHLVPPNNIEDFLQEIGRAGRDTKSLAEFNNGKIISFINKNNEDFETHKNQLNSSKISWQDLEILRKIIVDYKEAYYANTNNIFLPHSICCISKEKYSYDAIKTKLRLYWLHRINYLNIKNYEYNYLLISIEKSLDSKVAVEKADFKHLVENSVNIGDTNLINISTFAQNLRIPFKSCIDRLISLQKQNYIKILNTVKIDARDLHFKNNEKELLFVKANKRVLSFDILFDACENLLNECQQAQIISIDNIENLQLIDKQTYIQLDLLKNLDGIEYIYLNNKESSIKYLSFEKRINNYIRYCIIDLLRLIPNLDLQQQGKDGELYHFSYSDSCIKYLGKIKNCCLEIINKLVDSNYLLDLNWSSFIIDNDFNCVLLESSLFILQRIGLIVSYSSLYDFGYSVTVKDTIYNEIKEEYKEGETLYTVKNYFDDFYKTKLLRIFAMDSFIANYDNNNINEYQLNINNHNFLHDYLLAKSSDDYIDTILKYNKHSYGDLASYISQEALAREKDRIRDNPEQYAIYNLDKTQSINVLAGPGSGKTYMLVLRCAKLIIEEGVEPSKMLILAYNRSVVVELKRRLHEMFSKLGFNTLSRRLRVFTFHGLIKFCLQDNLEQLTFEEWTSKFLHKIQNESLFFTNKFRDLEYIFIDEFQDINQERLDCIKVICELYPGIKLFTIGDMNQSIYGYERVNDNMCGADYKRFIDPRYYYDQLSDFIKQKQLHLSTNYRSFKQIIDLSTQFFTCDKKELAPCQKLIDTEPKNSYVNVVSIDKSNILQWKEDLLNYLRALPSFDKNDNDQIRTIAVLCRSNDDVFNAYSVLKSALPNGIKIRIQGASSLEFWRDCYFYDFIDTIQKQQNKLLDNNGLEYIKNFCKKMISQAKVNKDIVIFNMNLAYILSVYFMQTKESKDIYYRDLYKFLTDEMESDYNFIYDIYYKYKEYHIVPENYIMLIISTIHKVKGLEFDAVFIPQSNASLPLKNVYSSQSKIEADLEEEKRLRYVAITRAKKYLSVYIYKREQALLNGKTLTENIDGNFIIYEKGDSLANYYINFCLLGRDKDNFIKKMKYIHENVNYGDCVTLFEERNFVKICHNGYPIASFSANKSKNLIKDGVLENMNNKVCFVNGIYVWRHEDALKSDKKNNTSYANNFNMEGCTALYVYVVCVYIQSEKEKIDRTLSIDEIIEKFLIL